MLDVFCTAYIDNILIYNTLKKKHREHVCKVLKTLQKIGVQADINKCEFHITEINYLGFIITSNSICIDPQKISVFQQ